MADTPRSTRITRRKSPLDPTARRRIAEGKSKGFEEIFAAELRTDHRVQRTFDSRWANKLVEDWQTLHVGVILVSRRADGSMFIIDGQHRVYVALLLDPTAIVDCVVYEGLTIEEEALVFLYHNTHRKRPSVLDEYNIALTAGLDWAIRMNDEALDRGLTYGPSASSRQIAAIASCRRIVRWDAAATGLLRDTLMYAEMAFGSRAETWEANMLQGIARVLQHNRASLDYSRLIDKLRTHTPTHWQALALQGTKGGGGSVSRSIAMARSIKEEYNKRLGGPRKLK